MNVQITTRRQETDISEQHPGKVWWAEIRDQDGSIVWGTGPHLSEAGATLRANQWARQQGLTVLEPAS